MVSYYICFAFSSCKSTFYETVQFHVTVIANSFILKYSVEMLNTSSDWKSKILFWFIFSVRSDILKYMVNNSKKPFVSILPNQISLSAGAPRIWATLSLYWVSAAF